MVMNELENFTDGDNNNYNTVYLYINVVRKFVFKHPTSAPLQQNQYLIATCIDWHSKMVGRVIILSNKKPALVLFTFLSGQQE